MHQNDAPILNQKQSNFSFEFFQNIAECDYFQCMEARPVLICKRFLQFRIKTSYEFSDEGIHLT